MLPVPVAPFARNGVAEAEVEAAETPTELVAVTVNEYVVPFVKPVIVQDVVVAKQV